MTTDRRTLLQQRDCRETCPYSRQEILLRRWEWHLFGLVHEMLIEYRDDHFRWRRPPPRVVCVDVLGKPALEGFAFGFRWAVESREIQIAVAASRSARFVKWWPLGRVWWVVEEVAEE
ncbi:MAG: hypothetical protein ACOY93_08490 [Bacillota bacterium]